MPTGKTSTLTFRIKPSLKDALRSAAEREHRSIANMVEVMIRDYSRRNGITIEEQPALSPSEGKAPPVGRRAGTQPLNKSKS